MSDTELHLPDAALPQIENIEIMELTGKGGMSLVYKARQKQLDRIVAVKVLSKMAVRGEEGIKRFQKEAKLTSTLDHPNIVKTISFGVSDDGQPYLVMEYLEGLSLADELKQNGRLKLQKFKDVFLPALSALAQAHETGLVHRDIKPGNIMICRTDSGAETVKLVDFGIAKFFAEGANETCKLTKSGVVLGSPAYMSPEQCQGKPLDGRSDLYSMACVMYETLCGEPPFSGDSLLEVMQKHSVEPPPTVSELSRKIDIRRELAQVTLCGLAKDPAARPQTASEYARKLNEVLERITLDRVPVVRKTGAASSMKPAQQLLAITLVFLCGLTFYIVAFMLPRHQFQLNIQHKTAADLKTASISREEREYERALASAEKTFGADSTKILPNLQDLAYCYQRQEKYSDAEPLLRRALTIHEKAHELDGSDLADSCADLGTCYAHQSKYVEAEPLVRRALSIDEKLNGPEHRRNVPILYCLHECLEHQSKHTEAEAVQKRARAIEAKEAR
jgi:serine/threonine protein kinase